MTTAKSQQVSSDADSSDDLIAELAKLMAQDAQTVRPEVNTQPDLPKTPVSQPAAAPMIRIPGMETAPSRVEPIAPRPAPEPSVAEFSDMAPTHAEEIIEPFRFDFGMPPARQTAAVSPSEPVTPAAVDVHDSIADLIAAVGSDDAETAAPAPIAFKADVQPEVPAEPSPMPMPTVQPASSSAPVPASSSEVVGTLGRSWTPTQIASSRSGAAAPVGRANIRAINLTPVDKAPKPRTAPTPFVPAVDAPEAVDNFRVAPIFGFGSPTPVENNVEPTFSSAAMFVPDAEHEPIVEAHVGPEPWTPPAPATATVVNDTVRPPRDEFSGADPIDEIESLIGQAVRVDVDQRAMRPMASPALRNLAASEPVVSVPEVAEPVRSRGADSVEDAILEAAKVNGTEIGWVEPEIASEVSPVAPRRAARERGRSSGAVRAFAGPLVAVSLLLVAGLGLYWVLGLSGRTEGPVPTLVADTTPIKQVPAAEPVKTDTQQSVVFNEIDGNAPAADEQLVSRDQSDVGEVTQVAPVETGDEGLANRKVRTVTVRPDGTIVSGEDSVAGAAILPVDRPDVPAVPGAETASPALLAAAASDTIVPAATPAAVTPTPVAATPVAATTTPVVAGTTVKAVDAAGVAIAGKSAPVPMVRPRTFTNTNSTPAATQPVAAAAPASAVNAVSNGPIPLSQALAAQQSQPVAQPVAAATAAPASSAPAYVQLSSQRSEADARASAARIQAKFGSLFSGVAPEIQRVDLGAKGIFWRVRVPASSLQVANQVCGTVRANGGDCFAM